MRLNIEEAPFQFQPSQTDYTTKCEKKKLGQGQEKGGCKWCYQNIDYTDYVNL